MEARTYPPGCSTKFRFSGQQWPGCCHCWSRKCAPSLGPWPATGSDLLIHGRHHFPPKSQSLWRYKLWEILKEMGIPYHLTCLLRNLYAGEEATDKMRHGTMDWFKIAKRVHQGCILSPCLFDFHAEYITQNARLDEAKARIKIAGRNTNNLRYVDDTTLMAKS